MMDVYIGWPQGIYLVLLLGQLIIAGLLHNKPREPRSAWAVLVGEVLLIALLYWGGFFS